MTRRRAFTLIEMLVATVLSAVLMAAVLSVIGGVARDRRLLHSMQRPTLAPAVDLLAWDLTNAKTMSRDEDGALLVLVGNGGIERATLEPDHRLVQVTYRETADTSGKSSLWRQQIYLDDPVRPQPWQELVTADFQSLSISPAPSDGLVSPVPARLRIDLSTKAATQQRVVWAR